MEIKIKWKCKEIIFGEWEYITSYGCSCLRRVPKTNILGTRIEWCENHTNDGIYWFRDFQGQGEAAGLYSLRYVYDQMYPNISYRIDQKKEAQDHMDEFINQYNSLKAFL